MNGEGIVVVIFNLIIRGGDCLRSHFSASNSIDELKLFVSETNISLIELIPDGPPPIFIF